MSTATRLGLLFVAPLLSAIAISAQQPLVPHVASAHDANKIYLDVVVTPKNGKPVANLQQQDFTLLDNKVSRPITSFRALDNKEPVSVILLIDAVNATFQNVNYQRQQLDNFLRANGGHLSHPMTLAFFTDSGTQIQQGYSTDGNLLSSALDQYTIGLRSIRRSSGFYGASDRLDLSLTTIQQFAAAESGSPGRKIILWISPGWPILSGPGVYLDGKQQKQLFGTVINLSTQLRKSHVTLYSVDPLGAGQSVNSTFYYQSFLKGISKQGQVEAGDLALQVLATQTGGLALSSSNDVAALLQQCMDDLQAYYEISFDPPPAEHGDEYHSIDVQVAKPGLTARTRTGYYSQP